MVDGDGTYPAEGACRLLDAYQQDPVDMVNGIRERITGNAFRPMHQAGTSAFARVLKWVFGYSQRMCFRVCGSSPGDSIEISQSTPEDLNWKWNLQFRQSIKSFA